VGASWLPIWPEGAVKREEEKNTRILVSSQSKDREKGGRPSRAGDARGKEKRHETFKRAPACFYEEREGKRFFCWVKVSRRSSMYSPSREGKGQIPDKKPNRDCPKGRAQKKTGQAALLRHHRGKGRRAPPPWEGKGTGRTQILTREGEKGQFHQSVAGRDV